MRLRAATSLLLRVAMALIATLARSTPADATRAAERSCAPGSDPEHCRGPVHRDSGLVEIPSGSILDGSDWEVTGSLRGVTPPDRSWDEVRTLTIYGLDGDDGVGLAPLTAFKHLRSLTLDSVHHVDLAPLAALQLEELHIIRSSSLDLTPLPEPATRTELTLDRLEGETTVPAALALSARLKRLSVAEFNDRFSTTP